MGVSRQLSHSLADVDNDPNSSSRTSRRDFVTRALAGRFAVRMEAPPGAGGAKYQYIKILQTELPQ
jgi:hypothetical protein